MANVEQRAEAEASSKGLSGQARKSYIGGVFNRIRQAHERATTPGAHGRKLFNRRERVQARLDARLAMQPHREAIDVLRRQRNERIAAHQDEPRESNAQLTQRILKSDLKPVRHVEGLNIGAEMAAGPNPTHLRDIYGQEQLPKALDLFPTPSLRKAARERGMPAGGSRHDVIARLAQPAAPAKPPKLPAKTALKISRRNPAHISVRDNFKEQRALHAAYGFDNLPPEVAARLRSLNGELNLRRAKESGGARSAMTDAERAARSTQARQEGFAPPSKPARDAFPARDRQIRDAVKHGAPDFPPGTLAAAQGKPAPTGVRLSVRPYTYHGNAGYLISGSDKLGRRISIFARSKSEAERMRDDIKAGRETMFDSER